MEKVGWGRMMRYLATADCWAGAGTPPRRPTKPPSALRDMLQALAANGHRFVIDHLESVQPVPAIAFNVET